VKLITVMDEATLLDNVAFIVMLVSAEGAKALQISAVPAWALVRSTSTHVRPPPATAVTAVFGEPLLSAAMNASRSSFPAVAENTGVVTVLLAEAWSAETFASSPTLAQVGLTIAIITGRGISITKR
jgi:hypothetical protein